MYGGVQGQRLTPVATGFYEEKVRGLRLLAFAAFPSP